MINSKQKGNAGEREWAKYLTEKGYPSRRGQQYSGLAGEDVVSEGLEAYHAEVKRCERLNIYEAMEQAIKDAKGRIPYVATRKNHKEWLVILRAEHFIDFCKDNENFKALMELDLFRKYEKNT